MADPVDTGNAAPGLTSVTVVFLIWLFLTFVVRVWTLWRKSDTWEIDDSCISLGLLAIVCHAVTVFEAISHGYGHAWFWIARADLVVVEKALYTSELFYILSLGLIRASIGTFNVRLTRDQRNSWLAHALIITCGIWTAVSMLIIAFRGSLTDPWSTRSGSEAMYLRWLGIEVSGLLIDLLFWASSTYFIWTLQMQVAKKTLVLAIFAIRLGLLPIVICRLYYLSPTEKHAHSTGTVASILTEAAVAYAFFSASVTCLKPFLQPFHSGYVISMVGARISGHTVTGTDSQGDSYHMLGNTRSAMDKNGTAVTISDAAGSRNSQAVEDTHWLRAPLFRPDQSNHQATVETKYRHHNSNNPEEMIISMTHEWTVSYEDNQHPAATKK